MCCSPIASLRTLTMLAFSFNEWDRLVHNREREEMVPAVLSLVNFFEGTFQKKAREFHGRPDLYVVNVCTSGEVFFRTSCHRLCCSMHTAVIIYLGTRCIVTPWWGLIVSCTGIVYTHPPCPSTFTRDPTALALLIFHRHGDRSPLRGHTPDEELNQPTTTPARCNADAVGTYVRKAAICLLSWSLTNSAPRSNGRWLYRSRLQTRPVSLVCCMPWSVGLQIRTETES